MSKFCKDCKHSIPLSPDNPFDIKCCSPHNLIDNVDQAKFLVSGIEQPIIKAQRGSSCHALRVQRPVEVITCGPEGLWFIAKDAT